MTVREGDRGEANAWSRLLPRPAVFRPQIRDEEISGFPEWAWQFKKYLRAIDSEMCNMVEEVEGELQTEALLGNMSPEVRSAEPSQEAVCAAYNSVASRVAGERPNACLSPCCTPSPSANDFRQSLGATPACTRL